jgi:hypothetical protein
MGFLLCSQSGDHRENSLAKLNYILEMKVGKKKNRIFLYSWLPIGTHHNNLKIWKIIIIKLKCGEFG